MKLKKTNKEIYIIVIKRITLAIKPTLMTAYKSSADSRF